MALFGLLGGKKTSVGLDIGSGIIKLAVIDHSGSEPELVKVATTEVAADAIIEHEVTNANNLEEGAPVMTRDLSVGSRPHREHMQHEKKISAEDSGRIIQA